MTKTVDLFSGKISSRFRHDVAGNRSAELQNEEWVNRFRKLFYDALYGVHEVRNANRQYTKVTGYALPEYAPMQIDVAPVLGNDFYPFHRFQISELPLWPRDVILLEALSQGIAKQAEFKREVEQAQAKILAAYRKLYEAIYKMGEFVPMNTTVRHDTATMFNTYSYGNHQVLFVDFSMSIGSIGDSYVFRAHLGSELPGDGGGSAASTVNLADGI